MIGSVVLSLLAVVFVGLLVSSLATTAGAPGVVALIWGVGAAVFVAEALRRRRRIRQPLPMVIPDVEPDEPPSECDCQTRAAHADHEPVASWTP